MPQKPHTTADNLAFLTQAVNLFNSTIWPWHATMDEVFHRFFQAIPKGKMVCFDDIKAGQLVEIYEERNSTVKAIEICCLRVSNYTVLQF